jgi:hypothetical protein
MSEEHFLHIVTLLQYGNEAKLQKIDFSPCPQNQTNNVKIDFKKILVPIFDCKIFFFACFMHIIE